MDEKKKRGRPSKIDPGENKKNSNKNVQKMILEKIGIDNEYSDILIELTKEFNISKRMFYLIGGSIGVLIFYFNYRKENKEKEKEIIKPGELNNQVETGEILT